MKQILIHVDDRQARIAVKEAGQLTDIRIEKYPFLEQTGHIYRGRVRDVLPGMQAAFVDIGLEKNAYLSIDDLRATHDRKKSGKKVQINELIHEGEELYVQIVKAGSGAKAARITSEISISGRYLVYLPMGNEISISRKIADVAEQARLTSLVQEHLGDGEGVIIRTKAAGVTTEQIEAEIMFLRTRWQEAVERSKAVKTPCLVLAEGELVTSFVRETLDKHVQEVVIDHAESYQHLLQMLKPLYPEYLERLRYYRESQPLFQRFGVDAEIDRLLQRQIPLASGGFLVIDRTEAMTVIDVNTGRFTGQGGSQWEETIAKTNLEAAVEVARQLRLRDIGGIVIIDFIDMKLPEHQEKVLERLRRELGKDPVSTRLAGMTKLGLVELTRKKERKNVAELLTQACPTCEGSGRILTFEETARRFLEEAKGLSRNADAEAIVALLPPAVHDLLIESAESQSFAFADLLLKADASLGPNEFEILYAGSHEEANRLYLRDK